MSSGFRYAGPFWTFLGNHWQAGQLCLLALEYGPSGGSLWLKGCEVSVTAKLKGLYLQPQGKGPPGRQRPYQWQPLTICLHLPRGLVLATLKLPVLWEDMGMLMRARGQGISRTPS